MNSSKCWACSEMLPMFDAAPWEEGVAQSRWSIRSYFGSLRIVNEAVMTAVASLWHFLVS